MHIAINTTALSGGHSGRGIGLYAKELIEALAKFEPGNRYSHFTKVSEIPKDADVVHYPFFDPFFLTLPFWREKSVVVTVHDLIPIVHKEHFAAGVRGSMKWFIQRMIIKSTVSSIITDSQSSKRDIERILGFSDDRVFSIPLAARSVLTGNEKISKDVGEKYKLNTKYVLYVGDINWNKNVLGMLRAFDLYDKKKNLIFVLVGKAFLDTSIPETKRIHKEIQTRDLDHAIRMPGFVPDDDLIAMYKGAQALLYPSFAEGFGFPVLEAMALGCPVVTSNTSSLPEIAGPAIQVDPQKPEDIRRGLNVVLSLSSQKKKSLIEEGRSWANQFSWKRVAHETMNVYAKVIRNNSGI